MNDTTIYRPVGNKFLDKCSPLAFWQTKEGLKEDFPDSVEIKSYNLDEFLAYCKEKNLSADDMKLYA